MRAHKEHGMTLIELMVSLAIGSFLMLGAITVFMQSRTTFRVTESLARMQENARFALDVLEPEIRMAHFWGLHTTTSYVFGAAAPTAANGPGPDTCGQNWTINLFEAVQGSNNSYGFGCAGTAPVETNADTLIVRRAAEDVETPPLTGAATLRIMSRRAPALSPIFTGTALPAGYSAATSEIHRMIANGYYVSRTSALTNGANLVPSLRVWTLLNTGVMQNQEVIAGVEDFQVQFGVDTDLVDTADRGSVDRWVNVNDPMITPGAGGFNPDAVVLAVRVWVRVRAERPENGFVDNVNYVYADQNVGPFNDNFRRLVVSKTIYLRNARPIS
ncbi:MAG TPA: PilW family protein [Gammaproteobacteria bacterium]|nr:PilW family protein [Gammaproteobacteria bacterium]